VATERERETRAVGALPGAIPRTRCGGTGSEPAYCPSGRRSIHSSKRRRGRRGGVGGGTGWDSFFGMRRGVDVRCCGGWAVAGGWRSDAGGLRNDENKKPGEKKKAPKTAQKRPTAGWCNTDCGSAMNIKFPRLQSQTNLPRSLLGASTLVGVVFVVGFGGGGVLWGWLGGVSFLGGRSRGRERQSDAAQKIGPAHLGLGSAKAVVCAARAFARTAGNTTRVRERRPTKKDAGRCEPGALSPRPPPPTRGPGKPSTSLVWIWARRRRPVKR
jgi:hypothetical protein